MLGCAVLTLFFADYIGKFLRYNPLARGGFILYLLILHLWTFFVLFFHTHSYETVHPDFGAGRDVAHGPHALMQQQPVLRKDLTTTAATAKVVAKDEANTAG